MDEDISKYQRIILKKGLSLKEFADIAWAIAHDKGWHEKNRSELEIHALIHTEISEATEQVREDKPDIYDIDHKPEGEAVELIDAIIRIMDYFVSRGWNIEEVLISKMKYNSTRSHRHGGKRY